MSWSPYHLYWKEYLADHVGKVDGDTNGEMIRGESRQSMARYRFFDQRAPRLDPQAIKGKNWIKGREGAGRNPSSEPSVEHPNRKSLRAPLVDVAEKNGAVHLAMVAEYF